MKDAILLSGEMNDNIEDTVSLRKFCCRLDQNHYTSILSSNFSPIPSTNTFGINTIPKYPDYTLSYLHNHILCAPKITPIGRHKKKCHYPHQKHLTCDHSPTWSPASSPTFWSSYISQYTSSIPTLGNNSVSWHYLWIHGSIYLKCQMGAVWLL